MANPFTNPTSDSVPVGKINVPKDAKRIAAHSESVDNDLKPVNNSHSFGNIGKKGIKGSGRDM